MKPVGMINISEHLFSVRLEGFFVGLRSNGPAREKRIGIGTGPRSQDDVISIKLLEIGSGARSGGERGMVSAVSQVSTIHFPSLRPRPGAGFTASYHDTGHPGVVASSHVFQLEPYTYSHFSNSRPGTRASGCKTQVASHACTSSVRLLGIPRKGDVILMR